MTERALQSDLVTYLEKLGLSDHVRAYLLARRIVSFQVLAHVAQDAAQVVTVLADRLIAGHEIGSASYKEDEDPDVLKGALIALWHEARGVAQPVAVATASSGGGGESGVGPALSAATPLKPPSTLAPTTWATRIAAYNKVEVGGFKRCFPERILLGAEQTLARMIFEAEVSHQYSPVRLGEIISTRFFTSTGAVNERARDRNKCKELTITDGRLQETDVVASDPRSLWGILDGIEAARWAMVFANWGSEPAITAWHDHFVRLTRSKAQQLDALRNFWEVASGPWRSECGRARPSTRPPPRSPTTWAFSTSTSCHEQRRQGHQRGSPGAAHGPRPRHQH